MRIRVKDLEDEIAIKTQQIVRLESKVEKSQQIFEENLQHEINWVGQDEDNHKVKVDALEAEVKKMKTQNISKY